MPFTPLKSSLQHRGRINCTTTATTNNNNDASNINIMTRQMQPHATSLPHHIHLSSTTSNPDAAALRHCHEPGPKQCCSTVIQSIAAPVSTVWSVLRRFDNPQVYKHFIKSCTVISGDGKAGTLREVHVISGLPAATSIERLDVLDDEQHVLAFSVVGGDHRLTNYRSVTTLHSAASGGGTIVVEYYVVDVPQGNTKEEACVFVDTIVKCNLLSLAKIAENSVAGKGWQS